MDFSSARRLGTHALALISFAGAAFAQSAATETVRPRYAVKPPQVRSDLAATGTPLTTWNGSFTYQGKTFNYNMVGTAPSTNATTIIQAYIIPVKIVITNSNGTKTTFDPSHVLSNGNTVTQNVVASPIFDSTTTYVQGGVNVGTTQYVDAYQRANFWYSVSKNPTYHVLLGGPTVLPEQTLSPPKRTGKMGSPFGHQVAEVDINWFDSQIQTIMGKFSEITPNTLPIFLTYNVYLTSGGCCIGGYHSAFGSASAMQAYAHSTYVDFVGDFAQDVSALSHEIGEWMDDPLVNNGGNPVPSACGAGAIMENGDPLENNANFGAYPYTLNGFTYNLQDLVTLPYFGAPPVTSVNKFFTFQGQSLRVCQNGA